MLTTLRRRNLTGGGVDVKNLNKVVLVKNVPGGSANVGTADEPIKYINQATHFYIFFDFTTVENFIPSEEKINWFGLATSNFMPLFFIQGKATENISYNSILYLFLSGSISLINFPINASTRTKILLEFFSSTGETTLNEGICNVFHNGSKYQSGNIIGMVYTIGQESSINTAEESSSIVQTWHEISIINQDITDEQAIKLTTI